MTWVERNPQLLAKIRTYISDFQNIKPTIFDYFEDGNSPFFPIKAESDRGVALLLFYCALNQNISESRLILLFQELWAVYQSNLFKLNRLPFEKLQNQFLGMKGLEHWPLRSKASGILRSLCDFFYTHGPVLPWLKLASQNSDPIAILSNEIFFMGKTSEVKTKSRYFLWLLTQLPKGKPEEFWNDRMQVPITPGQVRFIFDFGPLKGKSQTPWVNALEKMDYCNRFYRMLLPGQSWMVYTALDNYLKPSMPFSTSSTPTIKEQIWSCRRMLNGCINCILAPECKGCEVL